MLSLTFIDSSRSGFCLRVVHYTTVLEIFTSIASGCLEDFKDVVDREPEDGNIDNDLGLALVQTVGDSSCRLVDDTEDVAIVLTSLLPGAERH